MDHGGYLRICSYRRDWCRDNDVGWLIEMRSQWGSLLIALFPEKFQNPRYKVSIFLMVKLVVHTYLGTYQKMVMTSEGTFITYRTQRTLQIYFTKFYICIELWVILDFIMWLKRYSHPGVVQNKGKSAASIQPGLILGSQRHKRVQELQIMNVSKLDLILRCRGDFLARWQVGGNMWETYIPFGLHVISLIIKCGAHLPSLFNYDRFCWEFVFKVQRFIHISIHSFFNTWDYSKRKKSLKCQMWRRKNVVA